MSNKGKIQIAFEKYLRHFIANEIEGLGHGQEVCFRNIFLTSKITFWQDKYVFLSPISYFEKEIKIWESDTYKLISGSFQVFEVLFDNKTLKKIADINITEGIISIS